MMEEILALCKAMGAAEDQQTLLLPLIEAVSAALKGRLKGGVTPQDCSSAFALAAAMLVMESLEQAAGGARVESFTAGDVSIRTGSGGESSAKALAERLLAPWLGETGFAFRGVTG